MPESDTSAFDAARANLLRTIRPSLIPRLWLSIPHNLRTCLIAWAIGIGLAVGLAVFG